MARFDQPAPSPPPGSIRQRKMKPTVSMPPEAQRIADWVREVYWLATSRAPRTQQINLGPSELGDPCDQKLMRKLLGMTPANHGRSDGWAATVGTALHAWLAEALEEYDSGRGRFLIEHSIRIPSELGDDWDVVGTLDLYDRKERRVLDHKALGEVTLDQLRETGVPDQKYQIQLQTYAYGLALQGEEPEQVSVVAWPRVEASLSKLHVWVAPYDPNIAREALARRDYLLQQRLALGDDDPSDLLAATPLTPSSLCRYCPHYKPYATDILDGCRGLQRS